ncbi:FGGY-family carbohydrate kinase [Providencia vermicola]|uniref:FGGY-family carbohydrate kinase n=1 Tax=Providencia vermicola TaxID=333965 RepID=UPI001CED80AF|nr:FGGY family carbohydrate kinase [Providencia vermicola]
MNIIAIDLGTTNIKVSIYDSKLTLLSLLSETVTYQQTDDRVEFDPNDYFNRIQSMVKQSALLGKNHNQHNVVQIVLTGQAESLVLLAESQQPCYPAISWLDMRSKKECDELSHAFDETLCYHTTGQPKLIPTWPITKMLWLKRHQPEIFSRTAHYLLLKDYIVFRLSGRMLGDYSIYSFSHYFDITKKQYWTDILDYCGVKLSQLPEVHPSGSIAGNLIEQWVCEDYGLTQETKINIGTLDHFAGMIGTGNIQEGVISESAGTVLSIATLVNQPIFDGSKIPLNCGPFPNSYVLLPVCESGGYSLEWFKNQFCETLSFNEITQQIKNKHRQLPPPIFLPYLTGVNAPDFNEHATGAFFAVNAHHDKYDFALSVMQGVACLLKKNLQHMQDAGVEVIKIVSVGGGAKSAFWTQLKSNFANQPIEIPENEEASSLGAAIIAAVDEGYFASFKDAISQCVKIKTRYLPKSNAEYSDTYRVFDALYTALQPVYQLDNQLRKSVH